MNCCARLSSRQCVINSSGIRCCVSIRNSNSRSANTVIKINSFSLLRKFLYHMALHKSNRLAIDVLPVSHAVCLLCTTINKIKQNSKSSSVTIQLFFTHSMLRNHQLLYSPHKNRTILYIYFVCLLFVFPFSFYTYFFCRFVLYVWTLYVHQCYWHLNECIRVPDVISVFFLKYKLSLQMLLKELVFRLWFSYCFRCSNQARKWQQQQLRFDYKI